MHSTGKASQYYPAQAAGLALPYISQDEGLMSPGPGHPDPLPVQARAASPPTCQAALPKRFQLHENASRHILVAKCWLTVIHGFRAELPASTAMNSVQAVQRLLPQQYAWRLWHGSAITCSLRPRPTSKAYRSTPLPLPSVRSRAGRLAMLEQVLSHERGLTTRARPGAGNAPAYSCVYEPCCVAGILEVVAWAKRLLKPLLSSSRDLGDLRGPNYGFESLGTSARNTYAKGQL